MDPPWMGGSVKQYQRRKGKRCTAPLKKETDASDFGRHPTMPYAPTCSNRTTGLGGCDQCRAQGDITIPDNGDWLEARTSEYNHRGAGGSKAGAALNRIKVRSARLTSSPSDSFTKP